SEIAGRSRRLRRWRKRRRRLLRKWALPGRRQCRRRKLRACRRLLFEILGKLVALWALIPDPGRHRFRRLKHPGKRTGIGLRLGGRLGRPVFLPQTGPQWILRKGRINIRVNSPASAAGGAPEGGTGFAAGIPPGESPDGWNMRVNSPPGSVPDA